MMRSPSEKQGMSPSGRKGESSDVRGVRRQADHSLRGRKVYKGGEEWKKGSCLGSVYRNTISRN